jgi:phosphatidylinositol 3-kinase
MNGIRWNEWLEIPIDYANMPLDTQVAITIWYLSGTHQVLPLAGTTFKLFGKYK